MSIKVLHVLEYSPPNISGYSLRSQAILTHQRKLGIDTAQMTSQRFQDFEKDEEQVGEFLFYRTQPSTSLLGKVPLLGYFAYINHLAERIETVFLKEKPDIIQAHSPMFNALAAHKVARKYNVPVTYEVRALWEDAAVDTGKTKEGSIRYRLIKAIEQHAFNSVDKVSCICDGLKHDIRQRGIPEQKMFVTPNAVDIEKFTVSETRDPELVQKYQLQGKKVIAFIGTFFKYEGLAIAVQAMQAIHQQRQDIHLLLVGGGNEEARLKAMVTELKLQQCVTFIARVPFDEVPRYYSVADALLFPRESIRLTELVTPLKPLESMAQGKPVFASDIGGHRELIEDGETGLLFAPDDPNALAESVLKHIDNDELLERIVSQGLTFVQTVRTWDNTAKQYDMAYRELLNGN
ncbi:TIGR04063 family PEP-CTERM/XrtA system glycosyltransferase [Alteromonas oceanisediminis]|uniref:TIGR04063 family PEP-CTERM/XrtA system glycosyltransferase n=1 Tax=Alteromonas oceanisediminis TaxID=2836180 RepID=UPI001BDB67F2|nr:TIGR04063 family PEP-CTERM/XrtA system glycosyltransferase [Alteromonas oceanisediminis]MBT0585661.1 glycosyltransferase, exosortase A system-associated [Alteromonas oceanisediminis]